MIPKISDLGLGLSLGLGNRDPSLIFFESVNFNSFIQTYAGTNRTRITAANVQEVVAANTIRIDHVGASLTPALLMEPKDANILLEVITDWTKSAGTTVTKNAVSWQGAANGAWTIVAGGADATVISTALAASSAAFTFVVAMKRKTGVGAVSMTIDNGTTWTAKTLTTSFQYFNVTKTAATPQLGFKLAISGDEIIVDCLMLIPNTAIASSYFAPASAIGDELATNVDFSAVTEGVELATGLLTVGNCYKISAHTDTDFTTVGAPDSNVGTYFNATATGGAGILDAGDKVFPVTFLNWLVSVAGSWAPQAAAGLLTGKAVANPAVAGTLQQQFAPANKVFRLTVVVDTLTSGTIRPGLDSYSTADAMTAAGTSVLYRQTPASLSYGGIHNVNSNAVVSSISCKEHGTVRLSEANTITPATPAAVSVALAATGTLVVDWMPSWASGTAPTLNILLSTSLAINTLYVLVNGALASSNGVSAASYSMAAAANSFNKLVAQWSSSAGKFKVGANVNGAGIIYGSEAAFNVPYPDDGTLRLGYALSGPMWIKSIRIYNKVLTDAQINALN